MNGKQGLYALAKTVLEYFISPTSRYPLSNNLFITTAAVFLFKSGIFLATHVLLTID